MPMREFNFGNRGQPTGRRDAARLRLALPARMTLVTGHVPCQVDDVSQTGACISVAGLPPPIGDDVILAVQSVEAFGRVVWRRDSRFGMTFDEPLTTSDLVELRAIRDDYQTIEQQKLLRSAQQFVQGRVF